MSDYTSPGLHKHKSTRKQ